MAIAEADRSEAARDHDTARQRYLAAIAAAPDAASAKFARRDFADTLISWGELDAAIAQLQAITDLDPLSAATWHDLGILREHQGDIAGAVTALRKARELAPVDPRPRLALAAIAWQHGDLTGATTEYRALLTLELPDRVRAKVQWALAQLATGAGPPPPSSSRSGDRQKPVRPAARRRVQARRPIQRPDDRG